MSFPANPSNGQAAIVNKITYQYSSATNTWSKLTSLPTYLANLTANNSITIGNLTMNGNLTNITAAGNLYIGGTGVFGTALNYVPANAPVQVGFNINNYSQFSIQNANTGNNASTDIAAIANNGSDNDTYVDMGIVGSGYSQASYNLYNPNDGYLIVAGNTITQGGNLILNTYQANDIIFATGGTQKNNEVMRVTSANVVNIKSTNTSTSTTTGALIVAGGAGVAGNLNVGGNTVVTGTSTFSSYISAPNTFGFKNRIINGAMQVWQRGTYFTVTTAGAYTVDRFLVYPTGASVTVNQGGAPAGFPQTTLNVTGATGVTTIQFQQRIESVNCQDLNSTTVAFSFWIYQSTGSAMTAAAVALYRPNAVDNYSGITQQGSTYTIPSIPNATWTKISTTFTTDSSASNGLVFILNTNTAVVGGQAVAITGVQLEKGSTATSFDYRPYGTELALCQRYFEMSYDQGTTPGSSTVLGMSVGYFPASVSGANIRFPVTFQVTKRADPSLSYWDGAGNASKETVWAANNAQTNNVNGGSQSFVNVGERGFSFNDANLGAYYSFGIHWTASAEL